MEYFLQSIEFSSFHSGWVVGVKFLIRDVVEAEGLNVWYIQICYLGIHSVATIFCP